MKAMSSGRAVRCTARAAEDETKSRKDARMDDRIVEFIQALRAAGVRVSLAESADSMRAIEQLGITDRDLFRSALRTTLVKEHADFPTFEQLFPIFFTIG